MSHPDLCVGGKQEISWWRTALPIGMAFSGGRPDSETSYTNSRRLNCRMRSATPPARGGVREHSSLCIVLSTHGLTLDLGSSIQKYYVLHLDFLSTLSVPGVFNCCEYEITLPNFRCCKEVINHSHAFVCCACCQLDRVVCNQCCCDDLQFHPCQVDP